MSCRVGLTETSARVTPAVGSSHRWLRGCAAALGALALAGAVIAIYGRDLHAPFVFDDVATVVHNRSIRKLWPLADFTGKPSPLTPEAGIPTSARPLVNLSFALDYHFGQLDTTSYHFVNFTIHALSALLLRAIVNRVLRLDFFHGQFERVAGPLSFLAALIWVVHPLNTESVAYITQRTESMMGFFYLATFYAALRYWEAQQTAGRLTWLVLAILAHLCGMLSKEMMASAIAMVWLFERTFFTGSFYTACKQSWPLYVGLALGWIPVVAINYHGPRTPLAGFHLEVPALVWWLTQTKVLMTYLKLAFWPHPLVIHYGVPYLETFSSAWLWLTPVVLLAIATIVLVWRRTAIGFVGAWLFAVLSPTLLIPMPGETLAERRMYVPLMALMPLTIIGAYALLKWAQRPLAATTTGPSNGWAALSLTTVAVLGLSLVYGVLSVNRLAAYQDELTLWKDGAIYQPEDSLIQANLGVVLATRGRPQEAIQYFEEALRLKPQFSYAHFNLGRALAELGRPQEAMEHYQQAVEIKPDSIDAQYNLGLALADAGRPEEAIRHLQEAVRLMPDFASAHNNLGVSLAGIGRMPEAIVHFERALSLEPDAEAYANLALAYAGASRRTDAIAAAQKAVDLAREQGQSSLAGQLEDWLSTYRARTPAQ